ncbi:protein-arginine deiminase family protein [Nonomuraea sp. NPDC003560]|uniref:protein-arginine deiminase family protein n=1 Tax=Nonomuraea sp. NPDC003560 TaxID=3364341 RepID=UPI00367C06C3
MRGLLAAGMAGLVLFGAAPAGAAPNDAGAAPRPDLRADTDRDGRVGPGDEVGKDGWTERRGALFLPNLDDSELRCEVDPADLDTLDIEVDRRLAACNDAADSRVNGPADALDLAPMRLLPMRGLSDQATGRLGVDTDAVRVFVRDGDRHRPLVPEGEGRLTAAELRSGMELALEGRDVVRDAARWDGRATVTVTVTDRGRSGTDRVQLREAPLLLQNDLQPVTRVFAGRPGKGPGWPGGMPPLTPGFPDGWSRFAGSLRHAVRQGGLTFTAGTAQSWRDVWWQDVFEPMTASVPGPDGPRTMRVMARSAGTLDVGGRLTMRPLGRLLFRDLRGPGVAVVQELTGAARDPITDLRSATGNIESFPPYRGYPYGRMLYGSGPTMKPDPAFVKLLTGEGYQPPVVVDTSWLLVGHVDETLHVVRADNERGWTLMVADPRLAVRLLRRVPDADTPLQAGTAAENVPTIREYLADGEALAADEEAAAHIDRQLAVVLAATGLRADELVRLPVLFSRHEGTSLLRAYTPGIPNGLSVNAREFAAPDPHGPRVGGADVFRRATEQALAAQGVRVRWVEDYAWAHRGGGEVHCTTNAWRAVDRSAGAPPLALPARTPPR